MQTDTHREGGRVTAKASGPKAHKLSECAGAQALHSSVQRSNRGRASKLAKFGIFPNSTVQIPQSPEDTISSEMISEDTISTDMISTGGNVTAQGSRLQALGACGRWPRRAPTVAPPYHPKSAATGARKDLSLREMTFSETRRGVMRHGSREEKLESESTGTAGQRQALRSHLCPCSNANADQSQLHEHREGGWANHGCGRRRGACAGSRSS